MNRHGRRVAAGIDQAIFSLTNFMAVVLTLRSGGTAAVGMVAIVLGTYGIAIPVCAAMAVEPGFASYSDGTGSGRFRLDEAGAATTGLVVGLLFSWPVAFVLWQTSQPWPLVAAALSIGLLTYQDAVRTLLHRADRAPVALGYQVVWLVGQIASYMVGIPKVPPTWQAIVSWLLGGVASALMILFGTSMWPSLTRLMGHFRLHGRRSIAFGLEQVATIGSFHAAASTLLLVAGFAEAGKLQVGLSLAGPVVVALAALRLIRISEAVNYLPAEATVGHAVYFLRWIALIGCPFALGWAVWVRSDPGGLLFALLGGSFYEVSEVASLTIFSRCLLAVSLPINSALRLAGLVAEALVVRVIVGVATVSSVAAGGVLADALGASIGLVFSSGLAVVLFGYLAIRFRNVSLHA